MLNAFVVDRANSMVSNRLVQHNRRSGVAVTSSAVIALRRVKAMEVFHAA